jgi:hypothetical protein
MPYDSIFSFSWPHTHTHTHTHTHFAVGVLAVSAHDVKEIQGQQLHCRLLKIVVGSSVGFAVATDGHCAGAEDA